MARCNRGTPHDGAQRVNGGNGVTSVSPTSFFWFCRIVLEALVNPAGKTYASSMGIEEIRKTLEANIGQRLRIEFIDGVTQSVEIGSVDGEGFLHSGPEQGGDPRAFSTCTQYAAMVLLAPRRCRWPRRTQWICGRAC